MTTGIEDDAPPPALPSVGDDRAELADEFLHGAGLQIGDLRLATELPRDASVRDVDDGEQLETIEPESVDFIVADHFLERCEDPTAAITTHLSRLRPGGILFYGVSGDGSRRLELATNSALLALVLDVQRGLDSFELETARRTPTESIVVLRKHGEAAEPPTPDVESEPPTPRDEAEPRTRSVVADAPAPPAPAVEATRDRIALAGLRMRLDADSGEAHWSIDPDGSEGRGLVQIAGTRLRFRLRVDGPLRLQGRARLLPHDWRDGTRAVEAHVDTIDADGVTLRVWAARLASAAAGGDHAGVELACEIPAGSVELVLGIDAAAIRDAGSVARAAWVEPAILDPNAAPDGPLATSPTATQPPEPRAGAPLVSVLLPVHDPPLEMLHEAVDSVLGQELTDWELCIVDDGSRRREIVEALRAIADGDPRVRLTRRERAGGISDATNAALALATGTYVALLDHDDRLTPNALALVAARIAGEPDLDMVYSDEGILQDERIVSRSIKPGWSPESLVSLMYTCHLGVYRRALVDAVGGLRPAFDGCQDYDLVLRLAERTDRVAHIPAELYHWRSHAASTAGGEQAKPYAYLAQPRALAEHLARRGIDAEVKFGALPGMHALRHCIDPAHDVAIVAACGSADELGEAARSWRCGDHEPSRVVLAAPTRSHAAISETLTAAGFPPARVRLLDTQPSDGPCASAAGLAASADAAVADGATHLVLMQQPGAALVGDWLTALVGHSAQDGVAVAGAVVLSADGRVADAGVALPEGVALPLTHGIDAAGVRSVTMNTSAASGVVTVSTATLDEIGAPDPAWGPLMLVELCVRASERGLRTVVVPEARLGLTGPDGSTNDLPGLWRLRRRWLASHSGDRFYNPRYRADRADFEPRVRL